MKTSRRGCFFAFTVFGPPIGGVLFILALTPIEFSQGNTSMSFPRALGLLFFTLFFSYIPGIVPAALTGALLSWIGVGLPRWRWLLTATATGAGVGMLCGTLLGKTEMLTFGFFLGALGAISALICALSFQPARRGDRELEPPHPAENAPDTAPAGD